jgi:glucokinase-like ROK family protein
MSHKRKLYKQKVLKQLYFADILSCAELSAAIKKSLPVTTRLISELIEEGSVLETGHAPSTGGRRPATYRIRPDVLYIVSVALDQFVTRIAIMDMQNNFVTPVEKVELPLSNDAGELMILTEKIAGVITRSGIPKTKIAGIGIGMPGFVDVQKGVNYSFLKLADKSIVDHISGVVGLPVFIDNDSSLIALAELRFGAARQKKNAMVVNIGWGIGLGMILNGQLFRGHNGFAGELSHIPLFSNGKLCSCGKSGCLETESSLLLVIEKVKEGLSSGRASRMKLSAMEHYEEGSEALVQAAREGDRFAIELFSQTAYNIGRGVAVLIHLLNPETIILSGRGSSAGKVWQAPIQQAVNEHCIPRLAMNTSIEMSTLGYDAELIGAAALVMENYEKGAAEDISSTAVEEDFLLEN